MPPCIIDARARYQAAARRLRNTVLEALYNTDLALITMQYFVVWTKIDFSFNFLTPIADLSKNTQTYYKIYSLLLPIYTTATAVKAVCKYCCRVCG